MLFNDSEKHGVLLLIKRYLWNQCPTHPCDSAGARQTGWPSLRGFAAPSHQTTSGTCSHQEDSTWRLYMYSFRDSWFGSKNNEASSVGLESIQNQITSWSNCNERQFEQEHERSRWKTLQHSFVGFGFCVLETSTWNRRSQTTINTSTNYFCTELGKLCNFVPEWEFVDTL